MPAGTLLQRANNLQIDSGEHMQLRNNGTTPLPFPLKWAKVDYTPAPGMTKIVPFEIICLFFGDPRSRVGMKQRFQDSTGSGDIPERIAEVARLSVRWGLYEQGMLELPNHMPDVTVLTLTNEEVITPAFDPQGETFYEFNHEFVQSNDIASMMAHLQNQLDMLATQQQALINRGGSNDDDDVDTDDDEDGPPTFVKAPK